MESFVIHGGKRLIGKISVSGSKNAALPIIFASLIMPGESVIRSVPDIGDVRIALELISELGADVKRCGNEVRIKCDNLHYTPPRDELTRMIRASTYLLGACLGRFRKFRLSAFGGCAFDKRPIDMHLYAAERLGADICGDEIGADKLASGDIRFAKPSVGASINALIMASSVGGVSRIFGYAKEPHVMNLIDFLRSSGVCIEIYPDRLEVSGVPRSGGTVTVIPDMIEAGTYLSLSLATHSDISVVGACESEMSSFLDSVRVSGVGISRSDGGISLLGSPKHPISVETLPHPGYPTDLQPVIVPVMATGAGGTVRERVWLNRFSYLDSLALFGLNFTAGDGYAVIRPSRFHPAVADAPDLRGGAALIIAALAAEGVSVVSNARAVMRGYENLVGKLSSVGADIYLDQ